MTLLKHNIQIKSLFALIAFSFVFGLSSCEKDDDDPMQNPQLESKTFAYEFNNGQVVPSAAYNGAHPGNLMAELMVEEMADGNAMLSVKLMNTVEGEMYPVHAHDAADPASTPNGTPYNESPNANILVQMAEGNGGTVSLSQQTNMSYDELVNSYEGFFVVHDPMQPVNTADISTYVVVGSFAREQSPTNFNSASFMYDFNTGQIAPALAYNGSHPDDLGARLTVQELAGGMSRVSVELMNTIDGEMYPTHAHDKADPASTPNGTPYNETPNVDVLVVAIEGTGNAAYGGQLSSMSYTDLTSSYEAFFVVHDPLQPVNTADPTTYVVLGNFARN